jgi:hypothetical protein
MEYHVRRKQTHSLSLRLEYDKYTEEHIFSILFQAVEKPPEVVNGQK